MSDEASRHGDRRQVTDPAGTTAALVEALM
jgi:hypothetical protein